MNYLRTMWLAAAIVSLPVLAQDNYSPGASATEIRIGQTMPYAGPVSAAGSTGHACVAYFEALNKTGGIGGRKINILSLDDGYLPPKTVEVTRKLVEDDGVLAMFGSVGTPTNASVQKYLNAKKIPQLFINTGATRFKDPKTYPWTLSLLPSYQAEGKALARYVLETVAQPKIAVLYQNDDLGKDFIHGFKTGLGDKASLIVSEQSFELTEPSLTSQMIAAKTSGANVLFYAGTQKHSAIQLKARYGLSWNPLHLLSSMGSGIETVLKPAGLETAEGVVTVAYAKDVDDPVWANDPDVRTFLAWAKANLPQARAADPGVIAGYISSALLEHVLKAAGNNLTREKIMQISTNLSNVPMPLLLPGISVTTTPSNYAAISRVQVQKFDHGSWKLSGKPIETND